MSASASFALVLASTSRYRRELLARLALPFETAAPDVDETPRAGEAPRELALRLALEKAQAVAARKPQAIVLFHTAVAVVQASRGFAQSSLATVTVRFRTLDAATIERYLLAEQPYDCAGSAKSEGLGIALLQAIESDDPTALIGLPLIRTAQLLRAAGLTLP